MHLFNRGVKLFDVADKQNNIVLPGGINQNAAFFFRAGQRFFHQAVNAFVEEKAADVAVGDRCGNHADGVNAGGNFFHRRKSFDAEGFGSCFGGVGENVINADQIDSRQRFVCFQVVFTHHTGADNSNFNVV